MASPVLDREWGTQDGVWACNVAALEVFLALQNQWRMQDGFDMPTRFIGLDYTAVRAGLDMADIAIGPGLFASLRQIETGARTELNGDRR